MPATRFGLLGAFGQNLGLKGGIMAPPGESLGVFDGVHFMGLVDTILAQPPGEFNMRWADAYVVDSAQAVLSRLIVFAGRSWLACSFG